VLFLFLFVLVPPSENPITVVVVVVVVVAAKLLRLSYFRNSFCQNVETRSWRQEVEETESGMGRKSL
jgi:hypothetical protein